MNSLRNGRDSHLEQIENDFKDPEDGVWEKNNSVSQEILTEYTRNSRPMLNTLPIASFTFCILFFSNRLFVLSNPTWRRARVTAR